MSTELKELSIDRRRLLIYLNLGFLVARGILWLIDNELKEDLKNLDTYRIEIEIKLDSIRNIKDKIKEQDSLTNIWQQLKKYNQFDISQHTVNELKAGTLSDELKGKVTDSLERSIKFTGNFFDSLSPNYNLAYRKLIDDEFRSLNKLLLNKLLSQKSKNERMIKLLYTIEVTVNILIVINLIFLFILLFRKV